MTHTYSISGMTCNGCATKVQKLLLSVDGVEKVNINLEENEADIIMHHHIQTNQLQNVLKDYPKYRLTEQINHNHTSSITEEEDKTWLQTYKPILLIFSYITVISLLSELKNGFNIMHWMNNFMGAFLLVFSFFKMLDLKAFSESYASYDIVAKRWMSYGYVYAFIELALGIAYIASFIPILINTITLMVMSVSIIGVLQSVLKKQKIKCACLGAVFNLPMSTVTIIEDLLMIIMSGSMLVFLLTSI